VWGAAVQSCADVLQRQQLPHRHAAIRAMTRRNHGLVTGREHSLERHVCEAMRVAATVLEVVAALCRLSTHDYEAYRI
jgi:hypothetical protein